jgi:hypothetical protein
MMYSKVLLLFTEIMDFALLSWGDNIFQRMKKPNTARRKSHSKLTSHVKSVRNWLALVMAYEQRIKISAVMGPTGLLVDPEHTPGFSRTSG